MTRAWRDIGVTRIFAAWFMRL
ncbi:MAG: hypothetical protein ACYDAA_13490 [Syntrophales bacterium]